LEIDSMALEKSCKTCLNGTTNRDGTIACGAPFEAFDGDMQLPSPVWAKRKCSPYFMILNTKDNISQWVLNKYGADFFFSADADRMHPRDGAECKLALPHSADGPVGETAGPLHPEAELTEQTTTTDRPAWQPSSMTADQFDRAIGLLCGDGGAKAMARALSRYHPSGASESTIARLVSRLRNDRDNIPAWIADGVVDMLDRTAKECAALADEIKSRERSPHSRNGGNPYS
jgi:hypothetical protein